MKIFYINQLLNQVNTMIKYKYYISYGKYWDTMHRNVDYTKPDSFF